MLNAPALPAIRAALARAPTSIVDRPVALDRELLAGTFGLRQAVRPTFYADVPVTAIVGLFHKAFAPDALTWRTLLDGVHGAGWGMDTLAYFESEIGDTHFPAPSAAYPLILRAYGGAVVCVNGMHRLVAGVCWLAAQQGPCAVLKKVELQNYAIKRSAVAVMADAMRRGERVDAAYNKDCQTVLIRVHTERDTRYWRVDGDTVEPVMVPGGWLDALRRRAGRPARVDVGLAWQPVSPTLIGALADDDWLRAQLDQPRYTEQPA
ncbi:hypothetical protein FAZ95_37040 [Trinickia violacea]|uniref:Uncharacterized protein n=2 Tax=Trinickia violacea TaxID=2571746 RepID=A0A4P8J3F6_9BURK|nr:hypothetical protein FAZ95_37040 [Trinickia violacea]